MSPTLHDHLATAATRVDRATTAADGAQGLHALYDALEPYLPVPADLPASAAEATELLHRLHRLRTRSHALLTRAHDAGEPLEAHTLLGFRRGDSAGRFIADHVTLLHPKSVPDWLVTEGVAFGPVGLASPGAPSAGPALQASLQTGDLLVTRAVALSSAGIAHLPHPHSQFSHNALVHRASDGSVELIACFMEYGTISEPLHTFLGRNPTGRIAVLRHRDRDLAQAAGRAAWKRVRQGPFIPYDDSFNETAADGLFCSQVPAWAFGPLLDRPADLPLSLSRLAQDQMPELYAALGMHRQRFLAPADYLYDPRLEIVAEWRDPASLAATFRHDAICQAMMHWASDLGYRLHIGPRDRLIVRSSLAIRRTPVLWRLLKDRLGPHTSAQMLLGGLALQRAAQILDHLLRADLEQNPPELALTPSELADRLEAIRRADLHPARSGSGLHRILQPPADAR